MALLPATLPLAANAAIFLASGAAVWAAGTRLAISADELSDRLRLGKAAVGLLLLATATELPEIVTSLTAASAGHPGLVLGNLFGGITAQTAILALADIAVARGPLSSYPRRPTHALEGALLIVLLGGLLAVTLIGDVALPVGAGVGSVALALGYALAVRLVRSHDERPAWRPFDMPEGRTLEPRAMRHAAEVSLRRLVAEIAAAGLVILVAGVALADSAAALAAQTGLGATFVGVTVLALSTSLPELSTTLAAARMGAYTLAISNIFGSNMIMVALILPADLALPGDPILTAAGADARFSLICGVIVTAVYVAGMLIRRTPSVRGVGLDSLIVLGVYLGSLWLQFRLFTPGGAGM